MTESIRASSKGISKAIILVIVNYPYVGAAKNMRHISKPMDVANSPLILHCE